MVSGRRPKALLVTLVVSLTINVLGAGVIAYRVASKGGITMLLERMNMKDAVGTGMAFQIARRKDLLKLPHVSDEIIFLGDSLIAAGPWAELYSQIKNLGIGGETSADILNRIDSVIAAHPSKLFILIGANDLSSELPSDQVYRNYAKILERLHAGSPQTHVVVIGVMPINPTLPLGSNYSNSTVKELNERLRGLVEKSENAEFLDLTHVVVDAEGNLRKDWTPDGLHLNLDGYLAINPYLQPKVLTPAKP